MVTTDSHGNLHGDRGRFSEKPNTAPGPGAALSNAVAHVEQSERDNTAIYALASHAKDRAARAQAEAAAEEALAQRLYLYAELRHLPPGHQVSTVVFDERPYSDGRIAVGLSTVFDADGNAVADLNTWGPAKMDDALPAGWQTDDPSTPYRTAFDVWRENSYDPDTRIDISAMHDWFERLDQPSEVQPDHPTAPVKKTGPAAPLPHPLADPGTVSAQAPFGTTRVFATREAALHADHDESRATANSDCQMCRDAVRAQRWAAMSDEQRLNEGFGV